MIVDDESQVLATLERFMGLLGWDPVPFGTFEDARAFLERSLPAALIVDVRLGGYNGLQLIHLAKQRHPRLKLAAMSGFDDPVLRGEAAAAGAAYLLKPLRLDDLRRCFACEEPAASEPATTT